MEGDWMGWRTVTQRHRVVDCVRRVGMGNGRGHSWMPVGGLLTDALISGSNLTAGCGSVVQKRFARARPAFCTLRMTDPADATLFDWGG
eukprot:1242163-Rhodomonas_salina.4